MTTAPVHETPSKPLARAIETVKVDSPVKPAASVAEHKKEFVVKANPNVKMDFERKYVGDENIKSDADGPSYSLSACFLPSCLGSFSYAEPLLQDNDKRFVLFPIKHHEVSPPTRLRAWQENSY